MIWLVKYWRVLAILALLGAGWAYHVSKVHGARAAGYKDGQRDAETAMAVEVAKQNAKSAAKEQRDREISKLAAVAWESKRAQLESQVTGLLSRPHQPIRLCKPASSGGTVPGVAEAARIPDGEPAASVDAVRMGRDIGRAGVVLAAECERYRAQLDALIRWINSVK